MPDTSHNEESQQHNKNSSHSEFYYELKISPSSHLTLFSDFLSDTLPVGFEERDNSFIIRSEDELETMAWGIEQFCEALNKALAEDISVDIELTKEQNSDWVKTYQESIKPISIEPFYIYPTWEDEKKGAINIIIDPALAFGTGHHPTTATCLQAIAKYVTSECNVVDVGCGSAILAIASAKLGAIVDACDTDSISVENSNKNLELNNIALNSLWTGSINSNNPNPDKKYDVVVANIVADVLTFIAPELKEALKAKSTLILSGIMDKYEQKVLRFYQDLNLVERITQDDETTGGKWITLVLQQ